MKGRAEEVNFCAACFCMLILLLLIWIYSKEIYRGLYLSQYEDTAEFKEELDEHKNKPGVRSRVVDKKNKDWSNVDKKEYDESDITNQDYLDDFYKEVILKRGMTSILLIYLGFMIICAITMFSLIEPLK